MSIAAALLVWIWADGDRSGQGKTMATFAVALLTTLGALAWAVLLSRLPGRARWAISGLAGLLIAFIATTVRVRGVTGDFVPLLAWRWSEPEELDSTASAARRGTLGEHYRDYPQFLGPRRDGVLSDPRLATDWHAAPPTELWRRPIGEGWSAFAVRDGLAVTQEQHGDEEAIVAYDLIHGDPVWTHRYPARYSTTIGGTGPRATPTLIEGRVVAMGATGILSVLRLADGELLWQGHVIADQRGRVPEWGKSDSPLVLGERVVVAAGGGGGHSLAAYDLRSGEPVWSAGSDRSGYSSPQLVTIDGVDQIVVFNQSSVTGHEASSGRLLWRREWPAEQPNVSQPLPLPGDRLLVSSGYGIGSKLLHIGRGATGGWSTSTVWESPRLKAKFTNLIHHRGSVYGLDDGVLVCLDPETGERRWKRGRYGHGQILLVGSLLLVQTEKGEIVLVEPDPNEHRELTRFRIFDGRTWNPPALAGDILVVRNEREAAAFRLPLQQDPSTAG
jgi:outer membrane protein assembly factor BamB